MGKWREAVCVCCMYVGKKNKGFLILKIVTAIFGLMFWMSSSDDPQ